MKVTVIMPVYNRAGSVARAISSILAQRDCCQLEVLVIDDGSTDGSAEVLAGLAQRHPEIRIVAQENQGVARARNTALAHLRADTEIVTFLDSDDLMAPRRLATDLAFFAADPTLDVTYGRMLVTNGLAEDHFGPAPDALTANVVGLHLSVGLFRRALFERVGGFDEEFEFSEDADFLFRLFEEKIVFAQTDTVCFYYLRHPENMTRAREKMRRFFALALLKRLKRRKTNPAISEERPNFDLRPLLEVQLF